MTITFKKRQKEMQRFEKRREKEARRAQKKLAKKALSEVSPRVDAPEPEKP